jgi:hypothetical protein
MKRFSAKDGIKNSVLTESFGKRPVDSHLLTKRLNLANPAPFSVMNSMSHGFVYLSGLSWLLCEVCISASQGFWLPVIAFLIGFILMFAILGCLPLSNRAIDRIGPIFTALIAAGILYYGVTTFSQSMVGGSLRIVGALMVLGVAVGGYLTAHQGEKAAH